MKFTKASISISILAFFLGCLTVWLIGFILNSNSLSSPVATILNNSQVSPLEESIPLTRNEPSINRIEADYSWIPEYYKIIDKRTEVAQISKLRSLNLPQDDVEVRVWFYTGYYPLEGFTLKKSANQWSAVYLYGAGENKTQYQKNRNEYQKQFSKPKSGWDSVWKRLVDAGLLTLPDATAINCNFLLSSHSLRIIVEYQTNQIYRTYKYDGALSLPAKCNEANQMIEINRIIREEFTGVGKNSKMIFFNSRMILIK